jgi:peroxiredoxin
MWGKSIIFVKFLFWIASDFAFAMTRWCYNITHGIANHDVVRSKHRTRHCEPRSGEAIQMHTMIVVGTTSPFIHSLNHIN